MTFSNRALMVWAIVGPALAFLLGPGFLLKPSKLDSGARGPGARIGSPAMIEDPSGYVQTEQGTLRRI